MPEKGLWKFGSGNGCRPCIGGGKKKIWSRGCKEPWPGPVPLVKLGKGDGGLDGGLLGRELLPSSDQCWVKKLEWNRVEGRGAGKEKKDGSPIGKRTL